MRESLWQKIGSRGRNKTFINKVYLFLLLSGEAQFPPNSMVFPAGDPLNSPGCVAPRCPIPIPPRWLTFSQNQVLLGILETHVGPNQSHCAQSHCCTASWSSKWTRFRKAREAHEQRDDPSLTPSVSLYPLTGRFEQAEQWSHSMKHVQHKAGCHGSSAGPFSHHL